jgi:hypothetical protein
VSLSAHPAVDIPPDGGLGVQYLVSVRECSANRVSSYFEYFFDIFLFSNRFDVLISKIFLN